MSLEVDDGSERLSSYCPFVLFFGFDFFGLQVILYSALAGTLVLGYLVNAVVSFIVAGVVLLFAQVGPPAEKAASVSGRTSPAVNASPTNETAGRYEI